MKYVDQTLTRSDEKLKLQALQARLESYEALDLTFNDAESTRVRRRAVLITSAGSVSSGVLYCEILV